MLTRDEARTRVARGAAHLDQVRPGWFDRIDIGTLRLHDPCGCIVGQLHGLRAWSQRTVFGLARADLFDFGFNLSTWRGDPPLDRTLSYEAAMQKNYAPLQHAWIEAIADRRLRAEEALATPVTDHAVAKGRNAVCVSDTRAEKAVVA